MYCNATQHNLLQRVQLGAGRLYQLATCQHLLCAGDQQKQKQPQQKPSAAVVRFRELSMLSTAASDDMQGRDKFDVVEGIGHAKKNLFGFNFNYIYIYMYIYICICIYNM